MKKCPKPYLTAALMTFLPLALPAYGQLSTAEKEDIGFTALQDRLGLAMPTGAGISVSQIEAPEGSGAYRPNPANFAGRNFTFPSGGNTGNSGHGNVVGQYFYGNNSLAPAVGTGSATITSYEANNWLGSGFLHTNGTLPAFENNAIQNHSWIGTTGTTATDIEVVRRLDYAIQRDNFVAVVGLNNSSGSSVPSLLAASYNAITVGVSSGNHSRGTTPIEGARTRPDIVVPTSATSWATATVSSAAALLMEVAPANGDHSAVIKAVLMAGASRNETEFATTWSHSVTQPLDAVYGAGELDVERSYDIIAAGEQNSSATVDVSSTGWDLGVTAAAVNNLYFFTITDNSEIGAALTWNRIITATDEDPGAGVDYVFAESLANLDLRLFSATGMVLGVEIAASLATDTNVELITLNNLPAGRYAYQISSNTPATEYGFAYYASSTAVVPEPSMAALLAISLCFFARRRK